MKKGLLMSALLIAGALSFSQKAFDEFMVDKTFQSFTGYTEKTLPTNSDVTITIDGSSMVNEVRQSLFGNNAVGWQGNLDTNGIKEANWKNGNYSMLRYPGGNWSNLFFWDGNRPASILFESTLEGDVNNTQLGNAAWMLGTDEYPDLLNFTGAEGIVCVNVGYAFYGTSADPVQVAADYAAGWVDHYNNNLGANITYWELGNENYGPWQSGFDLASAQQYADACLVFATAMKAKDPTIKIGVVLYEGEGGFNSSPQAVDWNETVLPVVQNIMDYAIIHHYPHPNTNKNNISEADIYDAIKVVEETVDMFHNQTETYTSKAAGYYPIAITEFNARTGVRELSRTNALFTTLMLGEYATYNDYGGAMQWDLQNGYDTFGGNHAAIATKDPFMTDGSANASLYVYHYMSRYFGDKLVASSSSNTDVITYATTFSSGEMGLVVVNKGSVDQDVSIDLGSFAKGDRMYWHTINGDESDFDRTIYINDVGPGTTFNVGQTYTNGANSAVATAFEANGVGGPQNYTSIQPFSALIGGVVPKFEAPRYSVSYIVFESAGTGCAVPALGPNQSICGLSEITLSTGLDPSGLTFTWKDGLNNTIGSGPEFVISNADTYTVSVDNGSCVQVDEIVVSDEVAVFDLGPDVNLCQETSAMLETNVSGSGISFSWEKDDVSLPTTANSYEARIGGVYRVEVSKVGCSSVIDEVVITSGLIDVSGDVVCVSGQLASLIINDSGDFAWYDQAENGTQLSAALMYDVPVNATTTYYVQDNGSTQLSFGKTGIDGSTYGNTGAGAYENANRTTMLTIEQDLTLESITLFVQTNGANVDLNINGDGYSQTWNFDNLSNAGDGKYIAVLGATLTAGTYTLDLVGTTGGIKVQHDNVGDQELVGYASFYTGGGNTDWYGMFFDWKISTGTSCVRTPVTAVLDESPGCVTSSIKNMALELELYPNPTTGKVNLSNSSPYELFSQAGLLLLKGDEEVVDLSDLDSGLYILKTDQGSFKVVKN